MLNADLGHVAQHSGSDVGSRNAGQPSPNHRASHHGITGEISPLTEGIPAEGPAPAARIAMRKEPFNHRGHRGRRELRTTGSNTSVPL